MSIIGLHIKGSRGDYRILDQDGQPIEGATMAVCYFNLASRRVVADLYIGDDRPIRSVPVLSVTYTEDPVIGEPVAAAEPTKKKAGK